MKGKPTSMADKLVWIGIGSGALFWILESAVHVFLFREGNLATQILTPGLNEIWMRLLVASIFIIFGAYAQLIINQRKRAEEALQKAHDELEQRVGEHTAELARTTEQLRLELTDRKEAEEALRESEARLRAIFEAAEQAKESLGDAKPQAILMFSCVGRKLVLGRRTQEEVEAVKKILGEDVPLAGFYTYGEIGPIDKRKAGLAAAKFHNETARCCGF